MGEYIMLDGVQIKIGTCEDLRYTDFPTYVDWLVAGRLAQCRGNEQPLDYIRPGAGASRFRFDGSEAQDAYTPTATVPAPLGFLLGEWEHDSGHVTTIAVASLIVWLALFAPCVIATATLPVNGVTV